MTRRAGGVIRTGGMQGNCRAKAFGVPHEGLEIRMCRALLFCGHALLDGGAAR
jgi:hypothetical protein